MYDLGPMLILIDNHVQIFDSLLLSSFDGYVHVLYSSPTISWLTAMLRCFMFSFDQFIDVLSMSSTFILIDSMLSYVMCYCNQVLIGMLMFYFAPRNPGQQPYSAFLLFLVQCSDVLSRFSITSSSCTAMVSFSLYLCIHTSLHDCVIKILHSCPD